MYIVFKCEWKRALLISKQLICISLLKNQELDLFSPLIGSEYILKINIHYK